jgi:CTD small phosphatase-like protein 2
VIIKQFDPDNKYFKERWYKKSCIKAENGMYIKDLSQLAIPLDRVVLVDNSSFSFGYQLFNGIPILSYTGALADMELMSLLDYLQNLAKLPDVRKFNMEYFKLHLLMDAVDPDSAFEKVFAST